MNTATAEAPARFAYGNILIAAKGPVRSLKGDYTVPAGQSVKVRSVVDCGTEGYVLLLMTPGGNGLRREDIRGIYDPDSFRLLNLA